MTDIEKQWERISAALDSASEDAIAVSDALGAHPELGDQEFESSKQHVAYLRSRGFDVTYPFCDLPTAYQAVAGKGNRPVVALLAEYDALPEMGHACGHNVHGAMSLLAGAGLVEAAEEGLAELRVIGTPAEETNGAKVAMVDKGVFDDVDLALMIHSGAGTTYTDYRCLAMDALEFTFTGRSAHAAGAPWEGVNALNGLQLFFHAIDMLRQHVRPEVRMHGFVREGGVAPNIVPEKAVGRFYFRAPWRDYLNGLVEQVYNAARGAALATGTEVTWRNNETSFDNLKPNPPAEQLMKEAFRDIGVAVGSSPGHMGSSDIGNVSHACPAIQPIHALVEEEMALHTTAFAGVTTSSRSHKGLVEGGKALARAILRYCRDPELQERIREDFRTRTS